MVKIDKYGKNSLVYIVMPCYNGERYLLEQLMSIYYQNYTNWYLIFVNDGSIDNSENIVRDWISHYNLYKKVKIINKENGGVNSAITRGLYEVKKLCNIHNTEALVSYCDQDDIWTRDKLNTQVKYMTENMDIGLSYHDITMVDENGELKHPSMFKVVGGKRIDEFLFIATFGTHIRSTEIMFKAKYIDILLPLPTGYRLYQDNWTMYIFYYNKIKIGCIKKQLARYRSGHKSLLHIDREKEKVMNKDKKEWYHNKYFEEMKKKYPEQKELFDYIINFNIDRHINWVKYPPCLVYLLIMFKYPKIFITGLKGYFNSENLS